MKYALFLLFPAVICFSCGHKEKQHKQQTTAPKQIHAQNRAPLFAYGNPALLEYDRYINQLDTESVQSGYLAVEKFQELFKAQPAEVCDTAFYIFNGFHNNLNGFLNGRMDQDSINYEQLTLIEENGHKPVLSKKQKAVARALEKNGFRIWSEEGTPYIEPNQQFIVDHFYKKASPVMKQYLAQINKEQKEGFQEDAGLLISPVQYADRTVWWEQFSKANPQFLYAKEAKNTYIFLLRFLLEGMDNTPVREYTSDQVDSLSDYYHTAYTHVQNKYAQSNTNIVVTPYLNAWLKKDSAEVSRLLNNFKKENGIE